MAAKALPLEVLSEQLTDAIAGRTVRTAVFTTYSFDPGFFEMHILPILFDKPFHQAPKVRMVQLEDAVRKVEDIAVYYDRTALSQDAVPAQLDLRRIDVRRRTGAFHPKLIMLLVENAGEGDEEHEEGVGEVRGPLSLIVATLSANLTRSGWWESVETGHIEIVEDKDYDSGRCSFRRDLLTMIKMLRRSVPDDEDHSALDRIHQFLLRRVSTEAFTHNSSSGGRFFTRLFCGQKALPDWLNEIRINRWSWNLEIISPFFDHNHCETLKKLVEAVEPEATRVYLPTTSEGTADVSNELFKKVSNLDGVEWATLPAQVLRPGARQSLEKALPRGVHAKVYRFWRYKEADVILAGSPNLTAAGHSHYDAGNLEAAFLVDITHLGCSSRWWLDPLERDPGNFTDDQTDETDESQRIPVDITFRYNWVEDKLEYRAESDPKGKLDVCEPGGALLFSLTPKLVPRWTDCGKDPASKVKGLLSSTSFLEIKQGKNRWRVLVREEGMARRPSIVSTLTPEEILMYWSLLSLAQQEYFIAEKLAKDGNLEGLPTGKTNRYITSNTVFDRFAGVYHAFEQLLGHVNRAIVDGEYREAEARMFGAKYDSLPVLLEKTIDRQGGDPVMNYVTFLCAKQVLERAKKVHSDFFRDRRKDAKHLEKMLGHFGAVRAKLDLKDEEAEAFLDWYERMFLKEIRLPETAT